MAEIQSPQWLTIPEVAEQLRCHPDTVRRLIHRGQLQASRIPGCRSILVAASDVDALLEPLPVGGGGLCA